jgi:hypothetical protein
MSRVPMNKPSDQATLFPRLPLVDVLRIKLMSVYLAAIIPISRQYSLRVLHITQSDKALLRRMCHKSES